MVRAVTHQSREVAAGAGGGLERKVLFFYTMQPRLR